MRSLREVREHLSGDRVQCLICGKYFLAVCHHARLVHGISAADYKRRFGLPQGRGVISEQVRQKMSSSISRTRATGRLPQSAPPQHSPDRIIPPYARADMRRLDSAAVESILAFVQAGETLTEACAHEGMPAWSWLHGQLGRDSSLKDRFDAVIEALPFEQQARMKKLGKRFAEAVRALDDESRTLKQIADALGVSDDAVRRHRQRNRS